VPTPDAAPTPPRREALLARTLRVLNRGGAGNPDVLLVEHAGRPAVLKDFAPRGACVRATVGRWVTAREAAAWSALDGHPAVPRFLGRVDALALLVEYRPGRRLSRREPPPAGFLDALDAAIAEMHARGVAHLDLRHRSNVLVDEAGRPVLIDFGSAFRFRPGGLGARLVLPLLARLDRGALAKWRRKLAGQGSAPVNE
jgi:predicted Ser/Thr protein kinase